MLKPNKGKTLTEEELMQQANSALQQRADELDQETAAELDRIRRQVVAAAEKPRAAWFMQPLYQGALAVCLVVVMVFAFYPQSSEVVAEASELELVLTNDDFEMLSEDPEFYQWLETQEDGV